jgi:hypothetical protein
MLFSQRYSRWQLLTVEEETELVHLLTKFQETGFACEEEELERYVLKTLQLRKENNVRIGNGGRNYVPMGRWAEDALKRGSLSESWFEGFYDRHPELGKSTASLLSPQRAVASTLETRDLLFRTRLQWAIDLGTPACH